jgi:hypothetical protein
VTPARQQASHTPGWLVTALALGAIGLATLTPSTGPGIEPSFACVFCGERAFSDILVNAILFAPLGVGLALSGVRARRAVLGGGLVSATVELAQLLIVPGRDPSIGDVLFNTTGTAVGIALVWLVRELASLDDRTSARLSIAAALDVALAVLLTGWLLQPSFPRTAYWGQWTPRLGHLEWYRGRIESARIADVEIRSRRIEDAEWARDALLRGGPVDVAFLAGPPVPGLASLFSVYDENRQEIFLVGPDRDDLVLRLRTRASAWRLDQPDLRAVGAWRNLEAGAPYALRAWRPSRGEWCLDGPVERRCELGFTIGAGWGMLFYAEWFPEWLRILLAVGWMAGLLVPTGFLMRRRWESVAAGVVVVVAVAVLPTVLGLRPTRGIEWVGVAMGLAAGALAARLAAHARIPPGP